MNRPEDIPERVWAEAVRHVGTSPNTDEERLLVAQAILAAEKRVREECADDQWRDLALQFDAHRIEALEMLRFAVRSMEEYATVRDILREPLSSLRTFLTKPPLAGEAVLAARLAAIRKGGEHA
jgi:hypothetical protein